MLFLSPPDVRYRRTFLEALREFQAEGRDLDLDYGWTQAHFAAFVQGRLDRADPSKVWPGWVPESWFWLIDGEEYIGTARIRHRLNESLRVYGGNIGYQIRPSKRRQGYGKQILRLALVEARQLGLTRALITCNHENIGSRRIIEANGGMFEGESRVMMGSESIMERRYWIEIPPAAAPETEDV